MPDAKSRAQWCRARAEQFLRLSTLAASAELAERYKDLADAYTRLAHREEELQPRPKIRGGVLKSRMAVVLELFPKFGLSILVHQLHLLLGKVECAMPIRAFLHGKAFDPETLQIMNKAFLSVCEDLGLSDKTDGACEIVAKRVVELTDGQRDPEAIRQAVLASIKAKAR